jgi:hypothetical protein
MSIGNFEVWKKMENRGHYQYVTRISLKITYPNGAGWRA